MFRQYNFLFLNTGKIKFKQNLRTSAEKTASKASAETVRGALNLNEALDVREQLPKVIAHECADALPSFTISKVLSLSLTSDRKCVHGKTSLEQANQATKYDCPYCGKVFKTKYTFEKHMKMPEHTSERPFACPTCGKGFRLSSTLCRHKIIHTNQRPFKCQICEKAFNRHSTLTAHYKTHKDLVTNGCEVAKQRYDVAVWNNSSIVTFNPTNSVLLACGNYQPRSQGHLRQEVGSL